MKWKLIYNKETWNRLLLTHTQTHKRKIKKWFKALSMLRGTKTLKSWKYQRTVTEEFTVDWWKRKVGIKCDQKLRKQIVSFDKLYLFPLSLLASITVDYYQHLPLSPQLQKKTPNQRVAQHIFIYSHKMNDNTQRVWCWEIISYFNHVNPISFSLPRLLSTLKEFLISRFQPRRKWLRISIELK